MVGAGKILKQSCNFEMGIAKNSSIQSFSWELNLLEFHEQIGTAERYNEFCPPQQKTVDFCGVISSEKYFNLFRY